MRRFNIRKMTSRHFRVAKAPRAGLALLIVAVLFATGGCYRAPYGQGVAVRPVSEDIHRVSKPLMTEVYFYPREGQTTEQQSRDHYECYYWAVDQTNFDPSQSLLPKEKRVKVVPVPSPGYDTATGAIIGAIMGALIAGPRHAGGGALVGAAGGAIVGAASDASRLEAAERVEEDYALQNRAGNAQLEAKALDFRRAMSACLGGRGYSVK